jgi:hypothetical protein
MNEFKHNYKLTKSELKLKLNKKLGSSSIQVMNKHSKK